MVAPYKTVFPSDLLGQVRLQLEQGQPQKALEILSTADSASPAVKNAVGVCLLRLGQTARALGTFTALVYGNGQLDILPGTPDTFIINLATARLMSGNVSGAVSLLEHVGDRNNPVADRLRAAVRQWERSGGYLRKWRYRCFGQFEGEPVKLDFPPGEL